MKIGIIGAGLIGRILAKKFSDAAHQVKLADRKSVVAIQAVADLACVEAVEMEDVFTDIDVLVIAIPLMAIPSLAQTLQEKLKANVVIIETTNYWPHRDAKIEALENGTVNSVWVQQQLGRTIVKAFSNIGAYSLLTEGKPKSSKDRIAIAVFADVQSETDLVMGLVDDAGFDSLDAGRSEDSWRQQACGPAYCTDLPLDQLITARQSTVEKQKLSFSLMKDLGQEFLYILVSGNYPDDFVDHAVDINRSINNLPPRTHSK